MLTDLRSTKAGADGLTARPQPRALYLQWAGHESGSFGGIDRLDPRSAITKRVPAPPVANMTAISPDDRLERGAHRSHRHRRPYSLYRRLRARTPSCFSVTATMSPMDGIWESTDSPRIAIAVSSCQRDGALQRRSRQQRHRGALRRSPQPLCVECNLFKKIWMTSFERPTRHRPWCLGSVRGSSPSSAVHQTSRALKSTARRASSRHSFFSSQLYMGAVDLLPRFCRAHCKHILHSHTYGMTHVP
jgi:hypothetical protein